MSAFPPRRLQAALALAGAAAALIIPLPSFCAAPAPVAPPVTAPTQRRTLPSGMRVIVFEQAETTLAALDLRVRVGSGAETPETNGTAHFIEHLVFKGTTVRPPGEIDRAIEARGGELKAQTTRDATRFATTLPAAGWKEALAVIAEMTLHPAFRPADVAAEKPVILSERAIARTEPTRVGFNALTALVFDPADPYHLPLMGSEANVNALTPEALRAFWQQWYRPRNMTLVIAGKVKAAEVFQEAERLFPAIAGDEPAPDKPRFAPPPSPESAAQTTIRDAGETNLTTVFIGFRVPSAAEPDAMAAVAGLVSLLAAKADEGNGQGKLTDSLITQQALALSVTANYIFQRGDSLVVLSATGLRVNAVKLENALQAALAKLSARGFTESDARQARQNLRDDQALGGTVEDIAARLALADILSLPTEETDDPALYTSRLLRVVTPVSLTNAARQYLAPDRGSVVVLGPPALP